MRDLVFSLATSAALLGSMTARADLKLEAAGYVETHLRLSLPGKALERHEGEFQFNENRFFFQGDVDLTSKVSARAAVRTVFVGFSNVPTAQDLTLRAQVDPFWWEMDAAYLELRDVGVEGFDLRLGRQIVHWGTADIFNPTNNINSYDFRDPLTFGQNIANNIIKLDYNAARGVTFTGLWVPVFRSAQIPVSGLQALTDPASFERRFGGDATDPTTRALIDAFLRSGERLDITLGNRTPDVSLRNSMVAAKLGFKLLGSDFSLSYFRGFFNIPRPETITPAAPANGVRPVRVDLGYPAMQALGFDFTTSIKALGGLGLWVEGAVVFHDALLTRIDLGPGIPGLTLTEQEAGQFLKLTAGVDFTFTKNLYANAQYVHGFVDEFGARSINDYVVAGIDIKNVAETVLFRLFGVLNLQDQSHIIYPALILRPWGGAEFQVGAFLYGGTPGTKFGGLESGSNLFLVRGRISF